MGPGDRSNPRTSTKQITLPLTFSPTCGFIQWRKDVRNWVEIIKYGVEKGCADYEVLMGSLAAMFTTLALPQAQENIVRNAERLKRINLKQ